MAGLTDRQQAFVDEYLKDLNATAAYKRAGYKAQGRAAENNASRLLGNAGVKAAIEAAQAERAQRVKVEGDDVLRELLRVALSDIGQVLDFSGTDPHLRPCRDIPEAARRAIAAVKVRRYTEGRGDDAREVEVTEFKLWDKLAALDKLAKHLGLLKDRVEHTGPGGGPIEIKTIEVVAARPRPQSDSERSSDA